MESLQLSQVLADLSNLGAAEPQAAAAIVSANTSAATKPIPEIRTETASPLPAPRPTGMKRTWSSDTGLQPKYDKYGRRIFLTMPNTSRSGSAANSTPGTPRRGDSDVEDDMERASTLMALYDIRSKLKQQDNGSLMRARDKINALAAKQQQSQQQATEQRSSARTVEELRRNRYSFPKPGVS